MNYDLILEDLWKVRNPYDALFLELIEGYKIIESNEYPNRIFYMKGKTILIDYNKETNSVCIDYHSILLVFINKFSFHYQEEFIYLMRTLLETHLNLQEILIFPYHVPIDSPLNIRPNLDVLIKDE